MSRSQTKPRLCASIRDWYTAAFPDSHTTTSPNARHTSHNGPTQHAAIACAGDEIRIGIAPDLKAAGQLAL